jgi:4-hydroxy-tetrahydrodipicolinate reductase
MLRVAVAGAHGKMGRVAISALQATDGIMYAGGFARTAVPDEHIVNDLDELLQQKIDVLLDLTTRPSSVKFSMLALAHNVRPVIGSSGWTEDERKAVDGLARERGIGALLVPNFSLGAVLMMRFAEQAAKYMPSVSIVEMHHSEKKDAPSGTARNTAERIAHASGNPLVPIHSVRMQGMLAHQEVMFGALGEVLTIRHDSLSRESFVPGMIAAVKEVMQAKGLVVGLDGVIG